MIKINVNPNGGDVCLALTPTARFRPRAVRRPCRPRK
jgi:hypothetical protein